MAKHALLLFSAFICWFSASVAHAQVRTLDEFNSTAGWTFIRSDGVDLNLAVEKGHTAEAVRFDYEFLKGTGYGGMQKEFPIVLADNFEFTFYLKAESPANNFEIKFIDSTGNNVWWVSHRNYSFPGEWKKIRIKKRHIQFAWGPTQDKELKRIDRIEFTVASFIGGRGSFWIDDLKYEPLPAETHTFPVPVVTATSSIPGHFPLAITDGNENTAWQTDATRNQEVLVDLGIRREFNGLDILWKEGLAAADYTVSLSEDGKAWETVYRVSDGLSHRGYIWLPETEARYIRLELTKGILEKGFGILELKLLDPHVIAGRNDLFTYMAGNSPPGDFPRYFSGEASYWTVVGVNKDTREALINEDGMVEVEKASFSIEPLLRIGDSLITWTNSSTIQSMRKSADEPGFVFAPSVTSTTHQLSFSTTVSAGGTAGANSRLYIHYEFKNHSSEAREFTFYLLVRPLQVNPSYQFLNLPGGSGKIRSIQEFERGLIRVDEKEIFPTLSYDSFSAISFDQGIPADLIRRNALPGKSSVVDTTGLANGVIGYRIRLEGRGQSDFYIIVPFHSSVVTPSDLKAEKAKVGFQSGVDFWKSKVNHVDFQLPASADRIINAYKANLAYILINRDKAGIQPGSRSYERSWIRDGALTSSALMKSGIVSEVREFIDWYASHLYENGKVPCVVDFRGPDPVPEHDSHGEMIYLIREYFNFTKDTAFLRSHNENVLRIVSYIESIIAERSTDHYRYGNDSVRAHYGLVPESISHEGYSAKPMHSYWDNFFTLKGLKDAAEIQRILGETAAYERIALVRDRFSENLYNSLQLAMKVRDIDYIPGCVELGDFDATSTTIALTPCNELRNLPRPQVYNTFEKYFENFRKRRDGPSDWVNYTPYENRLIGSFILLDQPKRAHELIAYFMDDQRPQGWHHWAEVVWREERRPAFIGDMPHTWVGSDFINAVRSMFVYEDELDQSLALASALYQDWIDAPEGMSVSNLPTYYGELSYAIKKDKEKYSFTIRGDLDLPANGIRIRNFNGAKLPRRVVVNGRETDQFNEKFITVETIPAEVLIYY